MRWLICCFWLLCLGRLNGGEATEEIPPGTDVHLLLPINETTTPKYKLSVSIPRNFVSLQPLKEWDKAPLIEFVPEGQNGEEWTEIISINKYIGQKIPADIFMLHFKKRMMSQVDMGQELRFETNRMSTYKFAKFTLSYDLKNRHEVMGAQFYSGPFDLVGVQYTVRASGKEALPKIEAFFANHVKVIKSESL